MTSLKLGNEQTSMEQIPHHHATVTKLNPQQQQQYQQPQMAQMQQQQQQAGLQQHGNIQWTQQQQVAPNMMNNIAYANPNMQYAGYTQSSTSQPNQAYFSQQVAIPQGVQYQQQTHVQISTQQPNTANGGQTPQIQQGLQSATHHQQQQTDSRSGSNKPFQQRQQVPHPQAMHIPSMPSAGLHYNPQGYNFPQHGMPMFPGMAGYPPQYVMAPVGASMYGYQNPVQRNDASLNSSGGVAHHQVCIHGVPSTIMCQLCASSALARRPYRACVHDIKQDTCTQCRVMAWCKHKRSLAMPCEECSALDPQRDNKQTNGDGNMTQDSSEKKVFVVEYATTDRAVCKECKKKISKGNVRMGRGLEFEARTLWYHPGCFFARLKRATKYRECTTSNLSGIDRLSVDDKKQICTLLEQNTSNSSLSESLHQINGSATTFVVTS